MNRTSASNSIRLERIDKILPYNKAFDYLTTFYSQKGSKTTRPTLRKNGGSTRSEEIDLTISDDEMAVVDGSEDNGNGEEEAQDELPGGSQANATVDPIDLAAGLPCKFKCHHACTPISGKLKEISGGGRSGIGRFPETGRRGAYSCCAVHER